MTPKLALLEEYALIARALGAPHRMMLLEQLAQGERGVEALAAKIGVTVANGSQHLQQLRRAGLVTSRRAGKAVIYRLRGADGPDRPAEPVGGRRYFSGTIRWRCTRADHPR